MKVTIYSRDEIEDIISKGAFPDNTAVISFYDPAIKRLDKSYTYVDYSNICDMVFYSELDDLDIDVLCDKGYTYETYFSEAEDMARFIIKAYSQGRDIICQCEYGQSRSAGCAAAIMEHFDHNGIDVFADYRRFPNQMVFNKLRDALDRVDSSDDYDMVKARFHCKLSEIEEQLIYIEEHCKDIQLPGLHIPGGEGIYMKDQRATLSEYTIKIPDLNLHIKNAYEEKLDPDDNKYYVYDEGLCVLEEDGYSDVIYDSYDSFVRWYIDKHKLPIENPGELACVIEVPNRIDVW